ncbi:MAG: hypothetical protein LQ343_002948 [Gyalolechia ehrenbergii]|nr:MAG: hypothetical protein LQ343_002948 [Gyalolechia ehrenbergii]
MDVLRNLSEVAGREDPDEKKVAKGKLVYVAFESEQTEVLSTYISLGSNGSEKIRRCTNVLFKAIQLGKPKMIESAPSHQADLEATNDQGKTALMVAVEGRCKGADTNARYLFTKTQDDQTFLHPTICNTQRLKLTLDKLQQEASLKRCIDAEDTKGRTPPHYAAAAENADAMRLLPSHGTDIKVKGAGSATALHFPAIIYELDDSGPIYLSDSQKHQMKPSQKSPLKESLKGILDIIAVSHELATTPPCSSRQSVCKGKCGRLRGFQGTAGWLGDMYQRYKLVTSTVEQAVSLAFKVGKKHSESFG